MKRIVILTTALILAATPAEAASAATLTGAASEGSLTLRWTILGDVDALSLVSIDASGNRQSTSLDLDDAGITIPVPQVDTFYALELLDGGQVTYSNPYGFMSPPCDNPLNWVDFYTTPPYVEIHWDCLP